MQHTRLYKGGRQAEIYVSYPKKLQQFCKVICNYNNVQQNAATSQPKQSYLFSKKLTWTYFTLVARERDALSISNLAHLRAPCFAHLPATLRKACVSDLLFPLSFLHSVSFLLAWYSNFTPCLTKDFPFNHATVNNLTLASVSVTVERIVISKSH